MKIQHNITQIKLNELPKFKEGFIERYSKLTDWEVFKKYSLSYLHRAIRVNTLKISCDELKERLDAQGWVLEQVPWCKEGFWAEHREGRLDLGNTKEHQLGYYYIQEPASMIPPIVLDPKSGELVLDMCAAPGSKTTQIAQLMNNEGLIVANDVSGVRLAPLGVNIQRLGILNVVQTLKDSASIKWDFQFDKILLDAPCSGVGTIRKSLKTINMWNPNTTKHIAKLQKRLLKTAWNLLKPGGTLVYSTCSTEPEENEEVISLFLDKTPDAKLQEIKLKSFVLSPAVLEFNGKNYNSEVKKTLRVWPQDNDTEGFYVAKLVKIE
jgi:tRNA (cytosine49-C5)-methyltransferase